LMRNVLGPERSQAREASPWPGQPPTARRSSTCVAVARSGVGDKGAGGKRLPSGKVDAAGRSKAAVNPRPISLVLSEPEATASAWNATQRGRGGHRSGPKFGFRGHARPVFHQGGGHRPFWRWRGRPRRCWPPSQNTVGSRQVAIPHYIGRDGHWPRCLRHGRQAGLQGGIESGFTGRAPACKGQVKQSFGAGVARPP